MNIKDFEVVLNFHPSTKNVIPCVDENDYYEFLCVVKYDKEAYYVTELTYANKLNALNAQSWEYEEYTGRCTINDDGSYYIYPNPVLAWCEHPDILV